MSQVSLLLLASCACDKALTKGETERQGRQLVAQWKDSLRTVLADVYANREIRDGDLVMPLAWTVFASDGTEDLALYISLHGGGGAPAPLNDQQWHNQQRLYRPHDAVYLCPRAPFNTWDLHFRPELDAFYTRIVQMATVFLNVNPDKVYLMGYSAGGDGVWRLAPRMADSWAAASMMAGHPGDVSLVGLRNTPFMIWCGADNVAYNRNHECEARIVVMDSLHRDDPGGYIFEGHIVEGKGHWMDRVDAAAIGWMEKYKRDPYPRKVVWRQEEVLRPNFYWLSAPKDEMERGKTVRLERTGNEILITQCDYTSLTLYFNDEMMNLDKPVIIRYGDKTLFKGKLKRTKENLKNTLDVRGDYRYMFPASVQVKLN